MNVVYAAIGYRCNRHCICCPIEKEKLTYEDLSLEEIVETVESALRNKSISYIELSGGEPTVQKEFIRTVKYICKEKNMNLSILTNAINFSRESFLRHFLYVIGSAQVKITTAIYGSTPEIHDYVANKKNSFNDSMKGLINCMAAGLKVSIKNIIQKCNYKDLPRYVEFIYESFPDNVHLTFHSIDVRGIALDNKDITAVEFREANPYLELAFDRVIEFARLGHPRPVKVYSIPLCTLDPYYWFFVDASSKKPTSAYRAPDPKDWKNLLMMDMESDSGTFFPPCQICEVERICPGMWRAYAEIYGTNHLRSIHK